MLRERMEEYYQKEKRTENHSDSESPQLPDWIKTLDFYLCYYKKLEAET
jgi:hypothetical protein